MTLPWRALREVAGLVLVYASTLAFPVAARSADAMPPCLTLGYAVDAQHGWPFLLIEIDAARREDFGDIEYAVYDADGRKVALTRVGLAPSLAAPGKQVGRVLVTDWRGRYELTIPRRGANGLIIATTHDARELIARARARLDAGLREAACD